MTQVEQVTAQATVPERDERGRIKPGFSGNLGGARAMRERAALNEAARQVEAAKLAAGLGREPTAAEAVLIEQASYLVVKSRRLRERGKPGEECARLLARILGKLGITADHQARPVRPSEHERALVELREARDG